MLDLSDEAKAGLVDALGGGVLEVAKDFIVSKRQEEAMERRKQMEMELAEARAQAMNQSSVPMSEADDTTPAQPTDRTARGERVTGRSESMSASSTRADVQTSIARDVVDQLSEMDASKRRVGMTEARDLDDRIRNGADRDELKEAMREYEVITPLVAQAR